MAGSGSLESIPVFFRAAEGLGLLFLVLVFIAAGSFRKQKVSAKTHTYTPTSRIPDRIA
jgi:hypothetical protein